MTSYIEQSPAAQGKLAIFIPSLRGGGAERIMVLLANRFSARGYHVDLVLAAKEGPYLTYVSAKVNVIDLAKGRVLASVLPLARYLSRERPDAIFSAQTHANIVVILARMLARTQAFLVVSERNSPSQRFRGKEKRFVLPSLVRLLYPHADRIVCISKGVENDLNRLLGVPKEKLETIHNPIDIDAVRDKMHERVDHPWLLARTTPIILSAGRLQRQKDFQTLLSAFAILSEDIDARLIILGQGEEEEKLRSLARNLGIEGKVAFPGFQTNPFSWMAHCDLFVMSSAWEGFGNVLVEAMACGAKVVSTDCPSGPSEILEDGLWGRLTPVGNPKALARAMVEALNDQTPPDVAKRVETFRVDKMVDQYAAVLFR